MWEGNWGLDFLIIDGHLSRFGSVGLPAASSSSSSNRNVLLPRNLSSPNSREIKPNVIHHYYCTLLFFYSSFFSLSLSSKRKAWFKCLSQLCESLTSEGKEPREGWRPFSYKVGQRNNKTNATPKTSHKRTVR